MTAAVRPRSDGRSDLRATAVVSIDAAALFEANERIRARARQSIATAQQLKIDLELTRTDAEIARLEAQLSRAPHAEV